MTQDEDDLRIVLDAALQHANNDQAWKNVPMPSYFETNLRRAEYRQKIYEAITRLKASLPQPAAKSE